MADEGLPPGIYCNVSQDRGLLCVIPFPFRLVLSKERKRKSQSYPESIIDFNSRALDQNWLHHLSSNLYLQFLIFRTKIGLSNRFVIVPPSCLRFPPLFKSININTLSRRYEVRLLRLLHGFTQTTTNIYSVKSIPAPQAHSESAEAT